MWRFFVVLFCFSWGILIVVLMNSDVAVRRLLVVSVLVYFIHFTVVIFIVIVPAGD